MIAGVDMGLCKQLEAIAAQGAFGGQDSDPAIARRGHRRPGPWSDHAKDGHPGKMLPQPRGRDGGGGRPQSGSAIGTGLGNPFGGNDWFSQAQKKK